ncbi:hypothetical protein [uncultured Lutibacter sp.]|uniref:hypothetical protein n=1 Tax=uncultured Lutibacter sp. TaxID=437739 RepID=UPI002635D683|nr:hypothetical protein [uncultured Lutibacter sp.]
MMRVFLWLFALCILTFSCKTDNKTEQVKQTEISEVTEIPVLNLAEFDKKAGEFISKEIKVSGIVDHVCKHGGKKILLVTDEGDAHVFSDERFEESLKGSEIIVTGIVLEDRIDEAYLLKMEEDNIKSHSEGKSNKEQFENKKKHLQQYRNKMKAEGINHISNYSLKYVSHTEIE